MASGSEAFDENSFNVRIDGRVSDDMNTFGRYSFGKFFRDGPTAFGEGGGQELVSLGGRRKPRTRASRTASTTPCRRRCWPISGSAGSSTRSTCCRSISARRRPPTPGFPVSTWTTRSVQDCRPDSSRGTAASTSVRDWASTAATARSIRTKRSGSWWATSRRCSARTASRPASTSGARTISGCRATRTAPAS